MKPVFRIAVRSLVEYGMRAGDLRFDYFGAIRAAEGVHAHQKVQRRRPEGYRAEVAVTHTIDEDSRKLAGSQRMVVGGRIDGLFVRGQRVVVEEIKTSCRSSSEIEKEINAAHWAQVQCYAYMWAAQESLDLIDAQLTYVHPHTGRLHECSRTFNFDELSLFFNTLLNHYVQWMQTIAGWRDQRNASLDELAFPFADYRTGQRDMAVAVYRTVRDSGQLFVQAATGIGKTMGVLFPALKALARQWMPKVIFLTARTTGRHAVETALDLLRHKGARIKSVTLTAKDKICFNPDAACAPEECAYAKGFFDRINQAVQSAFEQDVFNRETIETVAKRHCVCPFEFSLELVNWADCVIGDYNYAFDPAVTLKRLFIESDDAHVVLVDEAHNLVDRARDMFSAQLDKESILTLRRLIKTQLPALHRKLGRINSWMVAARRQCREAGGAFAETILPDELVERVRLFAYGAQRWLEKNHRTPFREDLVRFFFDASAFIRVAEQFDAAYAAVHDTMENNYRIKLFCMDPAPQLRRVWQRCRASILLSATLTPADYFQTVLGCGPQTNKINLASPFPPSRLAVLSATHIAAYYKQRQDSCASVCRMIEELVSYRKGHYLVFFPSYAYLKLVYEHFSREVRNIECLVQSADMGEAQRDAFLGRFENDTGHSLVGFAVLGGVFGEGIDLKGNKLTGAAIIGVGLPGICVERDLIRQYYDERFNSGFEFAYQYPGMTRVLQAAGRVIRSEEDKGVILLMDTRYRRRNYHCLFPTHWRPSSIGDTRSLRKALYRFWRKTSPDLASLE